MPYELTDRIDLLEPKGELVSGTGERVPQFRKKQVAARLLSDRGRSDVEDSVQLPLTIRKYIVRFKSDLNTSWRALVNGEPFEITDVALVPNERRKGYLQILAERSHRPYSIIGKPVVNGEITIMLNLRYGLSADAIPEASELNLMTESGMPTFGSYSGERHWLIAKDSLEGDIHRVIVQGDETRLNQIEAFSKYEHTVDVDGIDLHVWVSNQKLTNSEDTTLRVA